MRRFTPLLIASLLTGCAHDLTQHDRIMRKIETVMELPAKAYPLFAYRRYYAASNADPDLVIGVYEHGGRPTRLWTEWNELPILLDGGCSVIHVTFRRSTGRIESTRCN